MRNRKKEAQKRDDLRHLAACLDVYQPVGDAMEIIGRAQTIEDIGKAARFLKASTPIPTRVVTHFLVDGHPACNVAAYALSYAKYPDEVTCGNCKRVYSHREQSSRMRQS